MTTALFESVVPKKRAKKVGLANLEAIELIFLEVLN